MPRLSVLMPARNAGDFVFRSIGSTLKAMPRDSELLVLDDGSDDDTLLEAARFSDERLRIFRFDDGRGVVEGLNFLAEQSDSKLIARMDADDVCLPHRFWVQERVFKETGGAVFGSCIRFGSGRSVRPTLPAHLKSGVVKLHMLFENPLVHPTLLTSREAITQVHGYRSVASEDFDLWLRMANEGTQFTRLGTPLIAYRQHQSQVTQDKTWKEWRAGLAGDTAAEYYELMDNLLGRRFNSWEILFQRRANVDPTEISRLSAAALEAATRSYSALDVLILKKMIARTTSLIHPIHSEAR